MQRFLRELGSFVIARSGSPRLVRALTRHRAAILVYHDPPPDVFERHLRYLARHYAFVTLDELVEASEQRRWESLPPHPLAITFDDGARGNSELADVLARHGVRPTIFLCTQLIGTARRYWWRLAPDPEPLKRLPDAERLARLEHEHGYTETRSYPVREALDRQELARLGEWVDFGSHTRFHPILPRCSDERAASEILDSKAEVEALTGRPCRHLAFPNGSYGERELRLARRAGYVSARSFDPGWNDSGTDRYRLRAFGVPDDSSVNRLAATLAGLAFAKRPRRADPGRIEHLRRGLRRHGLSGTALIAAAAARKRVFLREAHVWYRLPLGEPTELGLEGLELIRPGNSNPGLLAGLPGGGPLSARRRFEAQGEPWVACLGGEPAFLCWTYPVRAPSIASPDGWLPLPPGTVCVDDVVTVAAFRGRGIAPAALAKIASSLASAGAETLIAKVETQNHSSRRAFEKAGFRAAAEMRLVRVGPRTRVEVSGAPDPLALFLAGELAR